MSKNRSVEPDAAADTPAMLVSRDATVCGAGVLLSWVVRRCTGELTVTWWDFLALAREERLGKLPDRVLEAYRLTIKSAWGDSSITRAERRANEDRDNLDSPYLILPEFKYRVVAHRLHFEDVVASVEMEIQETQWGCLAALLREARFWELPENGGPGGMDGADWLVEGNREGRYHWVSRWSPDPETDQEWLVLPCQYLEDLAELAFLQASRGEQGAAADGGRGPGSS